MRACTHHGDFAVELSMRFDHAHSGLLIQGGGATETNVASPQRFRRKLSTRSQPWLRYAYILTCEIPCQESREEDQTNMQSDASTFANWIRAELSDATVTAISQ